MGKVIVGLSVSLDGFIAGPNDGPANPLGDGGERVFAWMNAGPNRFHEYITVPDASVPIVEGWMKDCGAMISGRRTFDIAGGWKDGHPIDVPNFVLTHEPPTDGEWHPKVRFVTEGVEKAVALAKEAAGDKDVSVSAGNVVQQVLRAGLLDEIEVSVTPCLLGGGVRLFDDIDGPIDLEQGESIVSEGVTHLRYKVVRN